jgi:hypothetical protein
MRSEGPLRIVERAHRHYLSWMFIPEPLAFFLMPSIAEDTESSWPGSTLPPFSLPTIPLIMLLSASSGAFSVLHSVGSSLTN